MSARWDILQTDTDNCFVFEPETEAKRYRAYMIENGFDPDPLYYQPDGSIIIKCEGQRPLRFCLRKLVTINVNGSRIERHA